MLAGRNLTIESAQNTTSGHSSSQTSKSGMIGTTFNPAFGNVKQDEAAQGSGVSQSSSQVASLQGDVTLIASGTYTQTASSVMALGQAGPLVGGDVNILAKNVVINEAYNTSESHTQVHSASTVVGGSASVGGISTDTLRGAANTAKAMGNAGDARMQALGAANLAMSGGQAYDAAANMAANGVGAAGYKVSVNVSRNKSESQSSTQGSEAVGSSIVGANNVNIVATGGGQDSNIRAVGSIITAGNTVNLTADNAISLEASKNTWAQQGTNSSSGASIGVGFAAGAQNGFTLELGVSQGRGNDNGSDVSYNNTHVSGGKAVNVTSGGDLNLKGAVIDAPRVTADVGGDLNIESLQDTSEQVSRQSSSGLNASLCIPPFCYGVSTVGGNVAKARADGSYASVVEQSGIKAGDGGFDVNVKGNTDLKGGVISSTQAAVDGKKNSFTTASLTTSDIENHSTYSGSGYSLSGSGSGALGDQSTAGTAADKRAADSAAANSRPGGSAGVGSASGSQTSTTKAEISGIAGDTTVRSDDTAANTGALVKNWDTSSLVKDVQAQAQITQEFGQQAAYQIGTYADKKQKEAFAAGQVEEAAKWAEGGEYRVAAHAASGLLAGGVGGALGAGVTTSLMPRVGEAIADMGLPAPVAQALGAATAAAIGAVAGGAIGAANAYNIDVNNRQLHPDETKWINDNAKKYAAQQGISEEEAVQRLAQQAYRQVQFGADGQWDASANAFLAQAKGLLPADGNSGPGYMFYATPAQKANTLMYAETLPDTADIYIKAGIKAIPNANAIATASAKDAQQREILSTLTLGAGAASSIIALASVGPTLLTWALTNPDKAVQVGLISAETGAAIVSGAITPTSVADGLGQNVGRVLNAAEKAAAQELTATLRAVAQQKVALQQEQRIGELTQLFNKPSGASGVTIGGKSYVATAESNVNGTTKVFDTASVLAADLQTQVFAYAGELAGGQPLKAVDQGVWATKLADGTTINVRSVSSSNVGRWTVDVRGPLTSQNNLPKYELKFQ